MSRPHRRSLTACHPHPRSADLPLRGSRSPQAIPPTLRGLDPLSRCATAAPHCLTVVTMPHTAGCTPADGGGHRGVCESVALTPLIRVHTAGTLFDGRRASIASVPRGGNIEWTPDAQTARGYVAVAHGARAQSQPGDSWARDLVPRGLVVQRTPHITRSWQLAQGSLRTHSQPGTHAHCRTSLRQPMRASAHPHGCFRACRPPPRPWSIRPPSLRRPRHGDFNPPHRSSPPRGSSQRSRGSPRGRWPRARGRFRSDCG